MIANRPVSWLIRDLIAQGDITMMAGQKKSGKSSMAAHLIASVTSGVPFAPGVFAEEAARGKALLYSGERRTASFARPRLEAAGADLDLVGINDRAHNIAEVIADLEKLPEGIRLVVIDPLKAYVNAANTSDEKARQIMRRLERIADKRNAAIVIVHHITLRRGRFDDPTEYIQGKQVWVEAALCAHMLCRLQGGFIFENVASNKQAGQRFEYNIVSHNLIDGTPTERIDMLGESQHSICDALKGQARHMVVKTRLERALDWLREYLKDGPKLRNDVYAEAEKAGHAHATLIRAKQAGGIEDRKRRIDGLSEWYLPGPDSSDSSGEPVEAGDLGESVDQLGTPLDANLARGATRSTGSPWYTPKEVMDAIHHVLGPCELDPASPAQPVHVQARRWFTEEVDGLTQSWAISPLGYLFLNPPWNGNPRPIPIWVDRLIREYKCGNVPRAIVVLPYKSSQSLDKLKAAGAVIVNLGRLKYGGATSTSRDDTGCFLLGFKKAQVDALVASFKVHGVRRADVISNGSII